MATPRPASRPANAVAASGAMVLMSTTSEPARAPAAMPSGAKSTCSTSEVEVTIVKTMSLAAATAAGVSAPDAPSATSGASASLRRANSVTARPRASR